MTPSPPTAALSGNPATRPELPFENKTQAEVTLTRPLKTHQAPVLPCAKGTLDRVMMHCFYWLLISDLQRI
jgi:hypothetical protein